MIKLSFNQWKKYIIAPAIVLTAFVVFPKFWDFILLLLIVITLHEAGHYYIARKVGYAAEFNVLSPFLASVTINESKLHQRNMVMVALGGPIPGMIIGGVIIAIGYLMGNDYLYWVGSGFIIINGLNILPVFPTDGYLVWSYLLSFNKPRMLLFTSFSAILTGFAMVAVSQYLILPLLIYQLFFIIATLVYYKRINYAKIINSDEYHLMRTSKAEDQQSEDDAGERIIINDLSTLQIILFGTIHLMITAFYVLFVLKNNLLSYLD